ncbi:cell surface glycoprotein 1 [Plakobranchus ocellatus]|uniref:Cell surface glycoprotein 1 n=1 Tax=Plakobranchus ocellatus TaxID=259542 RepID=A0AAV4DB56_9GAST|nr:cell surface glycoprotein 1 [Plakobranchus ocellatus]
MDLNRDNDLCIGLERKNLVADSQSVTVSAEPSVNIIGPEEEAHGLCGFKENFYENPDKNQAILANRSKSGWQRLLRVTAEAMLLVSSVGGVLSKGFSLRTKQYMLLFILLFQESCGHLVLTYPPARTYPLDFSDNYRTRPPCGMPHVHRVISGFQALRHARAPAAGLEPATADAPSSRPFMPGDRVFRETSSSSQSYQVLRS